MVRLPDDSPLSRTGDRGSDRGSSSEHLAPRSPLHHRRQAWGPNRDGIVSEDFSFRGSMTGGGRL